MRRGERAPILILEGLGLVEPLSKLVSWLEGKGVPVEVGMRLEEILDFAKWEEHGIEYRLHFQQGQVWQADVRTPVRDGVLMGTKLPVRW